MPFLGRSAVNPGGEPFVQKKKMTSSSSIAPAAPATSRPLWRTYLAILLPMILTNTLQVAAGTIDGIYLGQMLGVQAIAAVSAFFPAFFMLLAIIIGLSTGATVLIGQAWGAGNLEKVRSIAGTAIALALTTGIVVSVAGGVFASSLLQGLGTSPDILPEATLYARIMFVGSPLIILLWLMTSMSRGVGDAVSPLWTLAVATIITMICTPALIRGWGGMPRLGVASAAVSTLVAFALALAWMALRWLRTSHPLAPNVELLCQIRFDLPTVQRMLRIGIPSSLQMFTAALAEIVLLGLVNGHGYNATAAYGAVNQVMSWIQLPAMSLGITATVLSAHAIGAGRNQRVLDIVRAGLWLNIVVTGAVVSIVYFMAPAVISLFLTDGPTASLAQDLLRTVAWSVVILGAANVVVGAMRASGTVLWPAMLGMVSILGVEVPFAYWLHSRIGISGIWWAYTVGFGSMLLLQSMYFNWSWRRQRIERLP